MKNLFKVAAFFVGTTMIFSSCECKQRTEPLPNPNPEPTPAPTPEPPKPPVSATDAVTLEIPAGTTEFKLYSLLGESLTIEGLSDKIVNVEPWGLDAKKAKSFKVENTPASIKIKGNIEELSIYSGVFDKIDLSNTPKTLKKIRIGVQTIKSTGLKVRALDFKGENNVLESILIGNIGLEGDYDMSSFSALKIATFIKTSAKFTLPNTIEDLMLEESHFIKDRQYYGIIQNKFNLESFPKMKTMYLIGSNISNSDINFSGSKYIETVGISRSTMNNINLSNSSLKNILIRDLAKTSELDLSNTPMLKNGNAKKLTDFSGFYTELDSRFLKYVNLSGASLSNINEKSFTITSVQNLDLSNNKLENASFAHIKSLKMLNLMGNTTLQGDNLKAALNSLPATNGTLRMSGLDAEMKKIVTEKGWTLQEQ